MLLPRSLPDPAPGSHYVASVQAAAGSCPVTIVTTDATGTTPETGVLGCAAARNAGRRIRGLARLDGRSVGVALPGGTAAAFHPGEGIGWSPGGTTP